MRKSSWSFNLNSSVTNRRIYGLRHGFTMVELLVVIAIILILVGLLMPTLGRVRETAKMAKCTSNMRQVAISLFLYGADNRGFMPYDLKLMVRRSEMFVTRSHDTANPTWKSYYPTGKWLAEYLPGSVNGRMNPIGYCPNGGVLGALGPQVSQAPFFNPSYGLNPDLGEDWWIDNGNHNRCSVPLQQVQFPGNTSLLVESNQGKTYPKKEALTGRHFVKSSSPALTPGPAMGPYPVYQYEGKVNVIFVDQHMDVVNFPEETPVWSCVFWDHSRRPLICPPDRDAGPCPWCLRTR